MKKILIGVLLLTIGLSWGGGRSVWANETKEDVNDPKLQERARKMEGKQNELEQNADTKLEEIQERRVKIITKYAERLTERFALYNARIEKLIGKLEKRIKKLEDSGRDMSEAKGKLREVMTIFEEAKQAGKEAITQLQEINPQDYDNQKALVMKVKELTSQAREQYRLTIQSMKEIVELIKGQLQGKTE